jgi:hypothetical protein
VVIAIDPVRDKTEIERLGIKPEFVDDVLVENYRAAGFEIVERGMHTSQSVDTSWAKRLQRPLTYLVARALPSTDYTD